MLLAQAEYEAEAGDVVGASDLKAVLSLAGDDDALRLAHHVVLLCSSYCCATFIGVDDARRVFYLEEHVAPYREVIKLAVQSNFNRVGVVGDDVALKRLACVLESCFSCRQCCDDVILLEVQRSADDMRDRDIRVDQSQSIVQVELPLGLLSQLVKVNRQRDLVGTVLRAHRLMLVGLFNRNILESD